MREIDEEHRYWLGFSAFQGIGPKRFALLKGYFGSARKAWLAKSEDLRAIGLPVGLLEKLLDFRCKFNLDSYILRLRENKVECYFIDDDNYPELLKKIDSAPFVIYAKGRFTTADRLAVGIVGSRRITSYGREATDELVTDLCRESLTIVSGLARGIDTAAHLAALSAGGRTIAVCGGGLDRIYPPENRGLADKIAMSGAVISEYPLGAAAVPGNFPARNRIIAGLSLGVVVIEGARDSGAMITANAAANQGREVFAVPGPITSPNSAGPAELIKTGAKLVWEAADILAELNLDQKQNENRARKVLPESKEEQLLLSLLQNESKHIDILVRESGLDIGIVTAVLSMMEIKGLVKNLGNLSFRAIRS
jgi:DNA processing protein